MASIQVVPKNRVKLEGADAQLSVLTGYSHRNTVKNWNEHFLVAQCKRKQEKIFEIFKGI